MTEYHRMLQRQLKRVGINLEKDNISPEYLKLFKSITNAYEDAEKGYYTIARSLDLSSQEMFELREKLQKEREIIQSVMSDGLCVFDEAWNIVSLNSTGAKLLYCVSDKVVGKHFSEVFSLFEDDDTKRKKIDPLALEGNLVRGVVYHCERGYLKTYHGIVSPIGFSINPLPLIRENEFNGAVLLFRSIQERLEAEMALKNAIKVAEKSNKAKTIFLANMSHEIRTPMNGIMGMLQLLMTTPLNDKQNHYVKKGLESANSLLKILGDILDFAKIEAGRVSFELLDFDLKSEIDSLMVMYKVQCEQKGINAEFDFDNTISTKVKGDPLRIKQILNNLVNNAIKFTPQGGKITITVKLLNLNHDHETLMVSVADSGIGIPQTSLNKIFDMFSQADESTTRKYGGTGLGLAITRQLVELMGGQIQVTSVENEGSTFSFTLKLGLQKVSATAEAVPDMQEKISHFDAHILLVEDNELNQVVATDMLKALGCEIDVVDSGESAYDKIQKSKY